MSEEESDFTKGYRVGYSAGMLSAVDDFRHWAKQRDLQQTIARLVGQLRKEARSIRESQDD